MAPLVATIMSIAAPYLVKGAEEFAKCTGAAAFSKAKALMERLQQWWTKEPVAKAAAEAFSSNPERYAGILSEQLEYDLSKDNALTADLKSLVDSASPYVDVIQKIEVARGVTGADIGSLISGHVRVQQDIRDGQNVTGFKADKVGGK